MCFSKEVSLGSFILGTMSSYALIKYGNKKYESANNIVGYFFMYIALMQLIDYLIWIDLDCTKGFNKFAGYIGPLLNNLQPTILYLLCNKYLLPNKNGTINNIALYGNIAYILYTSIMYLRYINNNQLCSGLHGGKHISWAWKHDFNYTIYQAMMLFNIFTYFHDKVTLISMIISYIFFLISYKYYKTNVGELWCYFVIYVPLMILVGEKMNQYK